MAYRTTPRMALRKASRRARILQTARRLFGRRGYHATTVPAIVDDAGISTGSFYAYFRSKEDVFAAVLEDVAARLADTLNDAIGGASGTFGRMRAAVERFVLFLAENPDDARILIVESSGLGSRLEQIRRAIVSSHARSVEFALARLDQRPASLDPTVAARCWVGAAYEAVYQWLETPGAQRMPPDRLAPLVADFNLRGIAACDHRPEA